MSATITIADWRLADLSEVHSSSDEECPCAPCVPEREDGGETDA